MFQFNCSLGNPYFWRCMLEHRNVKSINESFYNMSCPVMFITAVCLIFLLKLKRPKNKSELWVVRQVNLEIFCFNEYGDNDETMILCQWIELQWGHSNYGHLVTIECGLVLWTGAFNVFTLAKCYTCNTIHHKKSLHSLVNAKKCTEKCEVFAVRVSLL